MPTDIPENEHFISFKEVFCSKNLRKLDMYP